MAFTTINSVTVGEPTKKTDYDAVFDNTQENRFRTMTAGAGGIVAYDMVYLSAADTVLKAKADAAATMPAIGIAPANIAAAAQGSIQFHGPITNASWTWTPGTDKYLYVSPTVAGGLTATKPTGANFAQPVAEVLTITTIKIIIGEPLQDASASLRGLLSSADWTAFNNKAANPHGNAQHSVTFEDQVNKGAVSGYASLNASSLVVQNPASKGQASGLAELNASSLVTQNPATATATPTAGKIPIADGSGKLDSWVTAGAQTAIGISTGISGNHTINCGFRPKYVQSWYGSSTQLYQYGRNETTDDADALANGCMKHYDSSPYHGVSGASDSGRVFNFSSTGFIIGNTSGAAAYFYWLAIG